MLRTSRMCADLFLELISVNRGGRGQLSLQEELWSLFAHDFSGHARLR
jgi:hypothetical protein